jgi:hypothetical protein
MARHLDMDLQEEAVTKGDLWDILLKQNQVMLSALRAINALTGNKSDVASEHVKTAIQEMTDYIELRDKLAYSASDENNTSDEADE